MGIGKYFEDFYWRLKTERDRKKCEIDNWKTILVPILIVLIPIINETIIEIDKNGNWYNRRGLCNLILDWIRRFQVSRSDRIAAAITSIIIVVVFVVLGVIIIKLINGYNEEISFIEDLMSVTDERYKACFRREYFIIQNDEDSDNSMPERKIKYYKVEIQPRD